MTALLIYNILFFVKVTFNLLFELAQYKILVSCKTSITPHYASTGSIMVGLMVIYVVGVVLHQTQKVYIFLFN